jgi:hypothetical protein
MLTAALRYPADHSQTYTDIELADQQAAIAALPAPPRVNAPVVTQGGTVSQNVR